MPHWKCVKGCGACCYLEPSDRPELSEYLSPEDLDHYLSLVGENGWCIHYNKERRECAIYEKRPWFCRVRVDTFEQMFEISPEEFDEFAIDCCQQHIVDIYGGNSPEINHYNQAVFDNDIES